MENVRIGSVVYLNAEEMYSIRKYFTVIGYIASKRLYTIIALAGDKDVIELHVPAASLTVVK